jgi:hypothetical protein
MEDAGSSALVPHHAIQFGSKFGSNVRQMFGKQSKLQSQEMIDSRSRSNR